MLGRNGLSSTTDRIVACRRIASAALIASLAIAEGFSNTAIQPVPNDRWTYGHGSTYRADGSPVQPGDTITRAEARTLLVKTVDETYASAIKRCAGDVPMTQGEFDSLVDLAYNIGPASVCRFSMIPKFRAGDYEAGCKAILSIDKLQGVHCADPRNKRVPGCKGVMNRRTHQYRICIGEKP